MSKLVKLFFPAFLIMLYASMPQDVLATEVDVIYSIEIADIQEPGSRDMLTVEVHNLSGGDLYNVQLQLESSGSISTPKEIILLGSIPAGKAQITVNDLFIDHETFNKMEPVSWRINFEDDQLNSGELLLSGTKLEQ